MASENSSSTLSFNTMVHMITIKLSSTNFLLWHSQVVPLLQCQKLYSYVDGSTPTPSAATDPATHNIWK
jgi:alpha-N-arabinofuranosidase